MAVATHYNEKFTLSLAYLFYAIAAVGGKVRIEEKRRIKSLVDQHWTFEAEGVTSRDIIFSALKNIIESNCGKEDAFQEFTSFYREHPEVFTDEIRKKIMDTANSITMAFRGINKSKSVLLSRLYFLLHEDLPA